MKKFYVTYLMPGLIFQSIVIGGGYGTGREMVEFFMNKGPLGGYFGILVSMLIWSALMAIGFELARKERLYDYRTFLKALLGRAWVLFEVVFVITMILVVAVVGSASGELLYEITGWPRYVGTGIMFVLVGFLVFKGSLTIERVLSTWSLILYAAYIVVVVLAFSKYGDVISERIGIHAGDTPWLKGGFQYAAYNLGALPAILFVARHFEKRREAVIAGLLSGPLAMIPAILMYTAMLAFYPGVLDEALPANFLIEQYRWPAFLVIFQIILFGTFIETSTGLIHGFNERLAGTYAEHKREMPQQLRLLVGIMVLVVAVIIANAFGLIQLIAKGYGYITWAFWIVFLIPLLILGSRKILRNSQF